MIKRLPMTQDDKAILTVAAYARHRGVTPEAVRYAIRNGHLKGALVYKTEGGPPYVDPSIGDVEWKTKNRAGADLQQTDETDSLATSRARKEKADAELAELKLDKEKGKLIEAEAVREEAFKVARVVRDTMLNIPDRIASELVGEVDSFKIHKKLTEEIRKALENLSFEEE